MVWPSSGRRGRLDVRDCEHNPGPFCPRGYDVLSEPGKCVFTYKIENGGTAGAQTGFFTFVRAAQ